MFSNLIIKKMNKYYCTGLPFAIMIGGVSGTVLGGEMLSTYIYSNKTDVNSTNIDSTKSINPLKGFGIIIGGFSLGLIGGIFYPISIPCSAVYFINITMKELKEDNKE